ncbi:hypothetical protein ABRP93_11615, partial [Corynebacterium sp. KPL2850]
MSTPPPTTTDHEPVDYDTNTDPDTDTDAEAGEPVVFYATNTPDNPIAAAGVQARKNSWGPNPGKWTRGFNQDAIVSVADPAA